MIEKLTIFFCSSHETFSKIEHNLTCKHKSYIKQATNLFQCLSNFKHRPNLQTHFILKRDIIHVTTTTKKTCGHWKLSEWGTGQGLLYWILSSYTHNHSQPSGLASPLYHWSLQKHLTDQNSRNARFGAKNFSLLGINEGSFYLALLYFHKSWKPEIDPTATAISDTNLEFLDCFQFFNTDTQVEHTKLYVKVA